ncbi:hypothetical protein C8R42DRAFT_666952 [Lentinula raphanica]|nr:hypothetical protein C8R42DRAFT_666952 [Lentinula raphanica]
MIYCDEYFGLLILCTCSLASCEDEKSSHQVFYGANKMHQSDADTGNCTQYEDVVGGCWRHNITNWSARIGSIPKASTAGLTIIMILKGLIVRTLIDLHSTRSRAGKIRTLAYLSMNNFTARDRRTPREPAHGRQESRFHDECCELT